MSHRCLHVWAVAVSAGTVSTVSAVTGPTAAPVTAAQDAEFWYVGRVQTNANAVDTHLATGSYIRQGVVLTAGHAVNADRRSGVAFERFQLGATRYFGLGVANPGYDPSGPQVSGQDLSLMLLLNSRANQPGEAFPQLADAGGAHALTQGQSVEVIGFTGPGGVSEKRRGVMSIRNPHGGDITATTYTYRAAGTDSTQPGDSGGPHLHDFGGAIGKRIVATTQSGNGGGISTGVRVDAHRPFIDGDGVGGKRTITKFAVAGHADWSAGASWARGSAGAASAPGADDVVVLDPSTGADSDRVVTVDVNTAQLDGLLNDVTLRVPGSKLYVTAPDGVNAGSGVLNGGVIELSGDAFNPGVLAVGASLDNQGTIKVGAGAEAIVALNSIAGFTPVSLLNGEGAIIEVGVGNVAGLLNAKLTSYNPTENHGTIRVGRRGIASLDSRQIGSSTVAAFINASQASLLEVAGEEALASFDSVSGNAGEFRVSNGGTLRLGTPLGVARETSLLLTETGRLNVQSGGTVQGFSHLDRRAAIIAASFGSQINVGGGAQGEGLLHADSIETYGKLGVTSGGRLNLTRTLNLLTASEMTVEGGAFGQGRVTVPQIGLEQPLVAGRPGASLTIKKGGNVTAARTALDVVGLYVLQQQRSTLIDVQPGGRLTLSGFSEQQGTLKIASGNDGVGLVLAKSDFPGNKTKYEQVLNAVIEFDRGAGASKPQFVTESADLELRGTVTGQGQFVMTGDTSMKVIGGVGPVNNPDQNFNGIDFVWDGARAASGAAATMEIFGRNQGAVPAGLTSIWGANLLCITGGSKVKLLDVSSNDAAAGTESLYVKYLGIMGAETHLDLNDKIVYYEFIDPTCGLNPSLISPGPNGLGRYIQIPAPSAVAIALSSLGIAAFRRRQRVL